QRAAGEGGRLFDDVREYATDLKRSREPCDRAHLWQDAWGEVAGRSPSAEGWADTAGVEVRCVADPFRLKAVFRNLFDNAVAAAGEVARVVVTCADAEVAGRRAVRVSVRDNGPGFTAEGRQRAFAAFYTTK